MTRKTLTFSIPAALLVLTGCTSSKYDQDFYDFDAQHSRTRVMLDAQYAKGAADDARMGRRHFDDEGELNALGRQKLDGIVEGAPRRDLKVWLDFDPPTPDAGEAMLLSVREFLVQSGVRETPERLDAMVAFGDGEQAHRSGDAVAAMDKLRNSGTAADAPAGAAEPGVFGDQ